MQQSIDAQKPSFFFNKSNHYQVGYDGIPFINRSREDQIFWVKYGSSERPVSNWRLECIRAAAELGALAGQNEVVLAVNGSLESQIVASSLRAAGVKFVAVILRFRLDYNVHDYCRAVAFCEDHAIPYYFQDLDVQDFAEGGEMFELASLCNCPSIDQVLKVKLAKMMSLMNGFSILASDDFYPVHDGSNWNLVENETEASILRYQAENKVDGHFGFFKWSPELVFSLLIEPGFQSHQFKKQFLAFQFQSNHWHQSNGLEKIGFLEKRFGPILRYRHFAATQSVKIPCHQLAKMITACAV
jgi:hypothetical protein